MSICAAELHIADDYGDNHATIKCQLHTGHDGPHTEQFERGGLPVIITWSADEREEPPLMATPLQELIEQIGDDYVADKELPLSLEEAVREFVPYLLNELTLRTALSLSGSKAEGMRELRLAAIHYVDTSKSHLSQYVGINGRHGGSPWAELVDAVEAIRQAASLPDSPGIASRWDRIERRQGDAYSSRASSEQSPEQNAVETLLSACDGATRMLVKRAYKDAARVCDENASRWKALRDTYANDDDNLAAKVRYDESAFLASTIRDLAQRETLQTAPDSNKKAAVAPAVAVNPSAHAQGMEAAARICDMLHKDAKARLSNYYDQYEYAARQIRYAAAPPATQGNSDAHN